MGPSGLLVGLQVPTSGSLTERVESSMKIAIILTAIWSTIFLYILIILLLIVLVLYCVCV
jgi:hypothetical protein